MVRPRFGVACLALVVVLGCGSEPRIASRADAVTVSLASAAVASDTALRLLAYVPAETLRSPDSLLVIVAFRNGGSAGVSLPHPLHAFSFEVADAAGRRLPGSGYAASFGMAAEINVPPGGFWGFAQPLGCPARTDTAAPPGCEWDVRLPSSGRYGIVVRYELSEPPDARPRSSGAVRFVSDTVWVVYVPGGSPD